MASQRAGRAGRGEFSGTHSGVQARGNCGVRRIANGGMNKNGGIRRAGLGKEKTEVRSESKDTTGPWSRVGRCERQEEVNILVMVEHNQGRMGTGREETQNDW